MPDDEDVIDISSLTPEQRAKAYQLLEMDPCTMCWTQYTCRRPHQCARHDEWLKRYYDAIK